MTRPRRAALAVPGDITTLTGGYIYDRRLLDGLRSAGRDVALIELGAGFPDPSAAEIADAAARLAALPADCPVLVDGLALGALPVHALDGMAAPLVAMVHHPLAHEGGLPEARRAHLFETERAILERASAVVVTSPHTADLLAADYGVPAAAITVARPGTDRPAGVGAPADPPLILSVGIRVRRKGHDVLLRALSRLTDLDWQAVIAGGVHDADHAAELDRLKAASGLDDRVTFAGRVDRDTLDSFYARASIFALATRYEGYGIVFDEAMAYGLPIVSCDTGAVPGTVPGDAGVLVPVEDVDAVADALRRLLTDPAHRKTLADGAARAGAALPAWDDTAATVAAVLDRVTP
ncbi:glycosyltransferase family 4 protein [Roseivivax jejudonensis]|nr:glycosyltransferase family 4 protein [Roseivivax jejudonensis]